MWLQIIGLIVDILGVVLLSLSGVFPVKNLTWNDLAGKSERVKRDILIARWGLFCVLIGFILQISGVLQQNGMLFSWNLGGII